MKACNFAMGLLMLVVVPNGFAALPVGAAPKGDPTDVASQIIKYNFPDCKRVTKAIRQSDGSIRAACDGVQYLVFTVFNAKEGRVIQLALNCTAAKSMGISC